MKKLESDVIVAAAGPAGLSAAVSASERGLKVLVFEKSNVAGGAANMGMGPLGIDTRIQRSMFNELSVEDALSKHMEYTHYRVDAELVSAYYHLSANTIEWLQDMGVEFAGAFRYSTDSEATWHIVKGENGQIGPRCAGAMTKALLARALEQGAEFHFETPVKNLIVEDGKVCGVIAADKTGEEIEARAKAVVVCTGGFGTNAEMVKEEFGLELNKDIFTFMIPGIMGDGLKMMWKAGAQKFGEAFETIYMSTGQLQYQALDMVFRQGDLMVNRLGKRIANEADMGNSTFGGNVVSLQPGKVVYSIIDGAIGKRYQKRGPSHVSLVMPEILVNTFEEEVERAQAEGYSEFFIAETIGELAEKIGIPADTLEETIDTYNEYCECGVDGQYGKSARFLNKITGKGKYMALAYREGAYGTVGGVRINAKCEVLDNNFDPIPGLYSAGTDANTIYGDSYNFKLPGNSMGFAVNTGRMAGEAMADYIEDNF